MSSQAPHISNDVGVTYLGYITILKVTQYQLSYFHIGAITHFKRIVSILDLW